MSAQVDGVWHGRAMTPDDGHKRCPDCAESVLAAARKCRYCGYRFDGGPRAGVLADLIRPPRQESLSSVLADWGVGMRAGERVELFELAIVDERPGYLLVTSDRVLFFVQMGRRAHAIAFEYPLSGVRRVRIARRRRRPRLQWRGPDAEHVVKGMGVARIRRLDAFLAEHGGGE